MIFQLQRKACDMIDQRELRLGNWLNGMYRDAATAIQIDTELFRSLLDGFYSEEDFEPILLTEEWLLRFGFEKSGLYWTNGLMIINPTSEDFVFDYGMTKHQSRIKYVHQLQNLFHALTGEELTIKEP